MYLKHNHDSFGTEIGYSNVSEACCGGGPLNEMLQCGYPGHKMCSNPNEYFFWDYVHPSERTYALLSKFLWAGDKNQVWLMNVIKDSGQQ